MQKFAVTVIDTAGIQDFIFGSNNLKQNIGASGLVNHVTHEMVYHELIEIGMTNIEKGSFKFNDKKIEKDNLNSELVFAGGGNTVLLFKDLRLAQDFTRSYTKKAFLTAPGLQLVISHTEFIWDEMDLAKRVRETIHKTKQKKYNLKYSLPPLGLGVNVDCQYTGLPASGTRCESDGSVITISSETLSKIDFYSMAKNQFRKQYLNPKEFESKIDFVYNFNDLGSKNESSYMAVVHIDGNSVGRRIKDFSEKNSHDNRLYIQQIRKFSSSINKAGEGSIKAAVNKLLDSEEHENGKITIGKVIEIRNNVLPFRPIVFGGDDITFVCDGRLGLTLTDFILRQLTSQQLEDGNPISARAGVAIVKTHYPFYQAVKLAYDLAESAKNYIKRIENSKSLDKGNISAIDWHFGSGSLIDRIENIRNREYKVKWRKGSTEVYGNLCMRPLRLGKSPSDWHSWETFVGVIQEFKSDEWEGKRNKVMQLREALRKGPDAVKEFVTIYKKSFSKDNPLPKISNHEDSDREGWIGEFCTCFDAIEALDFFVPLNGGKK